MRRWILLLTLCLLPGCDVATVALIMGGQDSGSSDDSAALPAPDPGYGVPIFKAWVAFIPDSGAANIELTALIQSGGNPSDPPWTDAGPIPANGIFNPDALPTDINAILITVSSTQNYKLDGVEILDDQNRVIDHASGSTWQNLVDFHLEFLGPPDGKGAVTTAAGATRAFIFTLYPGPIDRFRVNGHGDTLSPNPGDVVAVGPYGPTITNDRPGGLAIDATGVIHVTLTAGDTARLARFNLDGTRRLPLIDNDVEITSDLATAGSHSVALNPSGVVFTSCSIGSGIIQIRRFEAADLAAGDIAGFTSGSNGDRVEHNSIAVDGSGFVIVVGGMNHLIQGRRHWRIKLPDTVSGTPVWQFTSNLDNNDLTTYWHAVTTGANDDIFTTGDLHSGLLGAIQPYTAKFDSEGDPQWDDAYNDMQDPSDVGHAIGLDNSGNVYVGGMAGTDTDGKDGVLLRYTSDGSETASAILGGFGVLGGDDEILDIAVDPADGSVYAVGYETVAGQGENMVIRKFVKNAQFSFFEPIWARTHHGGFGNDRAVSCALYGNNLVVAGYETNSAGLTKFVLRVYEK